MRQVRRLANGNTLICASTEDEVWEVSPEKKIVWEYDAGKQNGNDGRRVEVHAFQRLDNGLTMIAESGPGRIIEVDREGKVHHEIKLKLDKPDPHRDTRLARKLAGGNYLVAHEGDGMVREYNADGKVVWEHDTKAQVYSASRLASGNTLIGCGSAHRVIEVDRNGKEVWTVEKDELPGITLAWVTMVERLPNGNTTIVNCHAGPGNPQMIEITPEKKVVWTFKDFKNFGNALPMARVLTVSP
jgi:outer membrane protein assembly factor BamB